MEIRNKEDILGLSEREGWDGDKYGAGKGRSIFFKKIEGFPGVAVVRNPPANAGDTGSSPGLGRSHTPWSN